MDDGTSTTAGGSALPGVPTPRLPGEGRATGADLGTDGLGAVHGPTVQRILDHVREFLGMEIAHLSRFEHGQQLILAASGDLGVMGVEVGSGPEISSTYCIRVLSGLLPPAVPDARRDPVARELPTTAELGIGSYVSAPVHDEEGAVTGMLCCLSRTPNPRLDQESVRMMRLAAALLEDALYGAEQGVDAHAALVARVRDLLSADAIHMVFQPIIRLGTQEVVALEALARFDRAVYPTPAHAFAAAAQAGLGVELELLAARSALEQFVRLPDHVKLHVNLSAEALLDDRTRALLVGATQARGRLVVEITEHTQVQDYEALRAATEELQRHDVAVAVDDAGAGFASLRHVLRLQPDEIKLDIDIIRGVDEDLVRQALTTAIVQFSASIGARLVAEGVETQAEADRLLALGVHFAQGYLFARPAPLEDAASFVLDGVRSA